MHFLLPFVLAALFFREKFWKASLIMLAANLIDLDHLLVTPIFDPGRCSIGFHYLHSYLAITLYFILLVPKTTRIVAIGLLFHIATDYIDCLWI